MKVQSIAMTMLTLLAGSVHASPDATGDAISKACPGIQTWVDKQKAIGFHTFDGKAAAQHDASLHLTNLQLRAELLQRQADDQAARMAVINAGPKATKAQWLAVSSVDKRNLAWMKARVLSQGAPAVDQVGEQGVSAFFILVQHADTDPAFQEHVLTLIKPQVEAGHFDPSEYAMLTDRVLRKEGKPQLYGSQFQGSPAQPATFQPQPIQDPAHLDERRAAMHLMPMNDYQCAMQTLYGSAHKNVQQVVK